MVPYTAQPFGDAEALVYSAGSVLVVFVTFLAFGWLSRFPKTSHFPLLGQQTGSSTQKRQYFLQNAQKVFQEGYQKFQTRVWRTVSTDGELLVLPILAADEVNKQPDHVVSRDVANDRTFETKLLGITFATPLMVHVVKADLTRHIPHLTQRLSDEVQRSVHEALGSNAQYVEVNVFPKLLRVVAIVSGLAFVGPDMYRQEEYITNSITFTIDLFGAISKLKAWPNWGPVRAIVARFIGPVKRLHMHRQKAYDYFIPRIQERRKTTASQDVDRKPKDMLQWILNKADKFDIKQDEEIAMILILLGVAAIHTTTMTVVHILYDLIGYCPEVIPELRKEIQTVMDGQGGKITTETLYQMKLLDSVMRESARLNPTNVMRMQRGVLQSFQLSDGTVIPAGVDIAVPALPVNLDESKYPNALHFDPYRFVRLRSGETPDPIGYGRRELYQFISVTKENMAFGFGKPACPGRFFAAAEIKLILIYILRDYDLKMPDGLKGRYANNVRGTSITPDFSKSIMIRRGTRG